MQPIFSFSGYADGTRTMLVVAWSGLRKTISVDDEMGLLTGGKVTDLEHLSNDSILKNNPQTIQHALCCSAFGISGCGMFCTVTAQFSSRIP